MVGWNDLIKFLRCISRIQLKDKDKESVLRFSRRDVPWESLGALAEMEGITGFLYHHMKSLGLLGMLPKSLKGSIQEIYNQTKQHTLAVAAEAKSLSARVEKAGIPLVALQGLSLLSVYGNPGLRPLGDVDLMVKQGYRECFTALLRKSGYQNLIMTYPNIFCKGEIKIDLHTHILNLNRIKARSYLFPRDLTHMWERATPLFDQVRGILMLNPSDNFIALSAHALKHSYSRLIWLVDLHELLLQLIQDVDGWESLVASARFWRQEKVVLYALILMEGIFGLKVPFRIKSGLRIHSLNILEKHILRLKLRGFSSNELYIALWLCNIQGAGTKLKFIKETVFPEPDIMAQIFANSLPITKPSFYGKRAADVIIRLGKDLHKAFTLSFSSGRKA
jgi:hypothetical protein